MQEILNKVRLYLSMDEADFAETLGVTTATVKRWENGKAQPGKWIQTRLYELCKKRQVPVYNMILEKIETASENINLEANRILLYHGSKSGIKGKIEPRSRKQCDFGQGFYMGTEPSQPLTLICDYEKSRFYIISISISDLKVLDVPADIEWAMLVAYHRGRMENGNDVELTLPSNASLGLFDAIKNALKDKGVPESSVNITLKGVMRIPQKAFGNLPEGVAPWFNVVRLPDATIIEDEAFQGSTLTEIYAPKVEEIKFWAFYLCTNLRHVDMQKASRIGSRAFEGCYDLNRVRFGALSSVGVAYDDGTGGIFDNCITEVVDLTLSSRQSMMELRYTEEATYEWVPAGGSYWGTEDYDNKQFLGYPFNKIICADD